MIQATKTWFPTGAIIKTTTLEDILLHSVDHDSDVEIPVSFCIGYLRFISTDAETDKITYLINDVKDDKNITIGVIAEGQSLIEDEYGNYSITDTKLITDNYTQITYKNTPVTIEPDNMCVANQLLHTVIENDGDDVFLSDNVKSQSYIDLDILSKDYVHCVPMIPPKIPIPYYGLKRNIRYYYTYNHLVKLYKEGKGILGNIPYLQPGGNIAVTLLSISRKPILLGKDDVVVIKDNLSHLFKREEFEKTYAQVTI